MFTRSISHQQLAKILVKDDPEFWTPETAGILYRAVTQLTEYDVFTNYSLLELLSLVAAESHAGDIRRDQVEIPSDQSRARLSVIQEAMKDKPKILGGEPPQVHNADDYVKWWKDKFGEDE